METEESRSKNIAYFLIWSFKHMFQSIINYINTKNIHSGRIYMEVYKMVNRIERTGLEEVDAVVVDVMLESNQLQQGATQYHITLDPENVEIKGKTGLLHEWIRVPKTATSESIPQGSVVDRYLQQVEIVLPEAKKAKTVLEALQLMKGKKFKFKRLKLGKAFEGHEAREYWCCVSRLA
jgi:hypothetical protein